MQQILETLLNMKKFVTANKKLDQALLELDFVTAMRLVEENTISCEYYKQFACLRDVAEEYEVQWWTPLNNIRRQNYHPFKKRWMKLFWRFAELGIQDSMNDSLNRIIYHSCVVLQCRYHSQNHTAKVDEVLQKFFIDIISAHAQNVVYPLIEKEWSSKGIKMCEKCEG